jgi:hypothetical protein
MLKLIAFAAVCSACLAAPADAQTDPAALPPVETMTCEQMNAEMIVAGMQMNAQLDHEGFATEQAEMQADMERRQNQAMAGMGATTAVCAIPGMGYACVAAQQTQARRAQSGMAESQARTDRQVGRITDSMAGLDEDRLMAINDRHQQMQCPTPQ